MATATQLAVSKLTSTLQGTSSGLTAAVASLTQADPQPIAIPAQWQIGQLQAAADLQDKTGRAGSPSFNIYVDRVKNQMGEKFRSFSGTVQVVVEVRVTQDRIDGLTETLQLYADAVTTVIENNRGDLGDGYFLTGGYDVTFDAVKRGGLNLQQIARVTCELHVSR